MTSNANGDDDLYFLPLGGSDEIGMNVNLYGYAGKWLMVDLGITFGDDSTPGLDVILPDISFIEKRCKDLVGLVITHGHEDHIGAIPYLWEKLRCPIWCTPFTASLVRKQLRHRRFHIQLGASGPWHEHVRAVPDHGEWLLLADPGQCVHV